MRYKYTYRTTAFEMWKLSMYCTYSSMIGVCNIVFTAAMVALIISRFSTSGTVFRIVMVLGLCIFTVFQPLAVYIKSKRNAGATTEDTCIWFDDDGMHIIMGDKTKDIEWSGIKGILKKPGMLLLLTDNVHGFLFTDRVLGKEKNEFYNYIMKKTGYGK